ncbi:mitochondrial carrier domain-containing protein [Podospora australis]|uniref:Mitochondrial carrier domain-containing protein n=1 Tax=Podospora australis TaxID=1536484 RepID=A0AAN7AJ93_9PEZI|nr:mitochondrial carrier domain-containing protein [Podospora australis]
MSQTEHHHLAPHGPTPPTSPAEYGIPFPHPPTPDPPKTGDVEPKTGLGGGSGLGAPMADPDILSPLERWAVNASNSQFNAISGAVAGFMSGVVTCPLDVIKTKLQAQRSLNKKVQQELAQAGQAGHERRIYKGLIGTGKIIWTEEGLRGMYRGLGPIIMGYLPTWAVWFTVYNKSKEYLAPYSEKQYVINFWSSIIAGGTSTIATNPIWVIKTRLMSQSTSHDRTRYSSYPKGANTPTSRPTLHSPWHYKSTWDAARKMYTTEGVLSFYSGLAPALLGLTHVAVQFPAYEFLKTKFTGTSMGAAPVAGQDRKGHWSGILAATILSKVMASSATYPHEVIRTRLQTQRRPIPGQEFMQGLGGVAAGTGATSGASEGPRYKGVIKTFKIILREEGWRAFYAGMGTNMMRAVPASTVTMITYEYAMRRMNMLQEQGKQKLEAMERNEMSKS